MDNIASITRRAVAFGIDDLVISLFLFVIFFDQIATLETPEALLLFLENNFLIVIALKIVYHWILIWQNGMTIGDYITKVKIVTIDTQKELTLFMSLNRSIWRILSEIFFYLGFLFAFFSDKNQTLHDKFSNAVAINAK